MVFWFVWTAPWTCPIQSPAFGFVRVVVKDGEPWFVGKDVAEVLGYKDSKDALKRHVDEEDKELFRGGETPPLNLNNYGAIIINEGGLYSLMLRSKLKRLPYLTCERFYLPCPYVSLRHFKLFPQQLNPYCFCAI